MSTIFVRFGWQVIACCRNPGKAEALTNIQAASEGRVKIHQLDVTDDSQIESLRSELDGRAIDILCNNAGSAGPAEQDFGFLDETSWLETFRVNTIAPYKMIRSLLNNVLLGRRRVIATIGSQMGSLDENNSGGYYAYRSSKSAVHMIMKNLSIDLREKGIVSVAFHPGWVRTDMGGSEAPLSPSQSAEGLFKTLLALDPSNNGSFLDYQGRPHSW